MSRAQPDHESLTEAGALMSVSSVTSVFAAHLSSQQFPCLAAKTAHARDQVTHFEATDLRCGKDDAAIAAAIEDFATRRKPEHVFHSLVVHFPRTPSLDEEAFETHLFARLQGIHEVDSKRFAWDETVSADPTSEKFSMSVGGKSFYVIGLHPGASRAARRLAHPAMVFNLHAQFEFLRQQGRYDRLREAIIERDVELNGSANPMLAVHGESSEALQYSGRHIEGSWECPFKPVGSKQ
ncbi:MAG: guanitoxin biosynthesis heme-dependent pre-guanitoxin N-hydroxylase GntA [Luteibacter sp.]|nr:MULTISPECIES: guanitoxin biosynthesis heme-dependent pre-guanitoxin N-hydroxylase GntA [unclassified Luteibacter]MDQ7995571.1 guanitoxin biosynthesis heme-dependent pre-guanitoxin N-hydroxylase GntA [Luteibacter sp.]MDQ8047659.1 guanitoxin biosynthesis heme-dependent pre-guanitoxin N-hydroxylase GntA [Luteibacter sp.]